jgi:hypothetical protein
MKKIFLISLFLLVTITFSIAQKVGTGKSTTNTTTTKSNPISNITNDEAGSAIKEALNKGVSTAVDIVGKKDGYWKNNLIKIPFPQEANVVANTLRKVGAGVMVDRVTESLNRAAEDAAQAAKPILINSIKQITVTDAINIIKGSQKDAATRFLQRTAGTQLIAAFKPAIKKSLDKTLATKYWKEATTRYNRVPLVKKVNTDLADYTTRKALDGLFVMVGKEEEKIRQNPKAFGSNIIDKVFGGLLGK